MMLCYIEPLARHDSVLVIFEYDMENVNYHYCTTSVTRRNKNAFVSFVVEFYVKIWRRSRLLEKHWRPYFRQYRVNTNDYREICVGKIGKMPTITTTTNAFGRVIINPLTALVHPSRELSRSIFLQRDTSAIISV